MEELHEELSHELIVVVASELLGHGVPAQICKWLRLVVSEVFYSLEQPHGAVLICHDEYA